MPLRTWRPSTYRSSFAAASAHPPDHRIFSAIAMAAYGRNRSWAWASPTRRSPWDGSSIRQSPLKPLHEEQRAPDPLAQAATFPIQLTSSLKPKPEAISTTEG